MTNCPIGAPDRGARPDLYARLSGCALAPEYASDLFDRIKSFRSADHGAESPTRSPAELLSRPPADLCQCRSRAEASSFPTSHARGGAAAPPAVSSRGVPRRTAHATAGARAWNSSHLICRDAGFAWDCSPTTGSRRTARSGASADDAARLSASGGSEKPLIVPTPFNAIRTALPAREIIAAQALSVAPGRGADGLHRSGWSTTGYTPFFHRARPGEYAVAGRQSRSVPRRTRSAVRFDFPATRWSHRSSDGKPKRHAVGHAFARSVPISNSNWSPRPSALSDGVCAAFGAPSADDPLYEAVSEGRAIPAWTLAALFRRDGYLFDIWENAAVARFVIAPRGMLHRPRALRNIRDH